MKKYSNILFKLVAIFTLFSSSFHLAASPDSSHSLSVPGVCSTIVIEDGKPVFNSDCKRPFEDGTSIWIKHYRLEFYCDLIELNPDVKSCLVEGSEKIRIEPVEDKGRKPLYVNSWQIRDLERTIQFGSPEEWDRIVLRFDEQGIDPNYSTREYTISELKFIAENPRFRWYKSNNSKSKIDLYFEQDMSEYSELDRAIETQDILVSRCDSWGIGCGLLAGFLFTSNPLAGYASGGLCFWSFNSCKEQHMTKLNRLKWAKEQGFENVEEALEAIDKDDKEKTEPSGGHYAPGDGAPLPDRGGGGSGGATIKPNGSCGGNGTVTATTSGGEKIIFAPQPGTC